MRVRTLALGAVATATQRGVVAPSQALEAQTLAALQSTVGTLATVCHNKLLLESRRGISIPREVDRLKPNGFERNADPCGCKG